MRWLACLICVACGSPVANDGGVDAGSDAPDASDAFVAIDAGTDAGPLAPSRPAPEPLIQWVDPFIGTGGLGFNDIGSTFPGPQRPFGMIRPGPDTSDAAGGAPGFLHCSGYHYGDPTIAAFSHTRMHGTGIWDYGTLGVMALPSFDAALVRRGAYRSAMVAGSERASPGFYGVTLERGAIAVELTASDRVALHRFSFAVGD
jgi:putative alpha-1,2-mannosidase